MNDPRTYRLFQWLDRAFWLIWLGFPLLIWSLMQQVLDQPAQLARIAPEQAACLAGLPQVALFSTGGKVAFWAAFSIEMAIYAILLLMVHRVIRRCARGDVFVSAMIRSLRTIGIIIAVLPVIDWTLETATGWFYVQTGDMPFFEWSFALDVPVTAVGLLLVTMAAAMRMAVTLHRDAELTI